MDKILIGSNSINITLGTQVSPLGKEFRISGTAKNLDLPSKFINGVECWHWIHSFKYLEDEKYFNIEIGYNNEFIKKYKSI